MDRKVKTGLQQVVVAVGVFAHKHQQVLLDRCFQIALDGIMVAFLGLFDGILNLDRGCTYIIRQLNFQLPRQRKEPGCGIQVGSGQGGFIITRFSCFADDLAAFVVAGRARAFPLLAPIEFDRCSVAYSGVRCKVSRGSCGIGYCILGICIRVGEGRFIREGVGESVFTCFKIRFVNKLFAVLVLDDEFAGHFSSGRQGIIQFKPGQLVAVGVNLDRPSDFSCFWVIAAIFLQLVLETDFFTVALAIGKSGIFNITPVLLGFLELKIIVQCIILTGVQRGQLAAVGCCDLDCRTAVFVRRSHFAIAVRCSATVLVQLDILILDIRNIIDLGDLIYQIDRLAAAVFRAYGNFVVHLIGTVRLQRILRAAGVLYDLFFNFNVRLFFDLNSMVGSGESDLIFS